MKGTCLLIENGVLCNRPIASRGLCSMHRNYLTGKGMLEEFALPRQDRKKKLELNPEALEGICRIIENGSPCQALAVRKGLCTRHYQAIWQRSDLKMEDFCINSGDIIYSRQKRPKKGMCVVCERTPEGRKQICKTSTVSGRRGLCQKHYYNLKKNPLLFEQIANPLRKKSNFRLKKEFKDGLCVIIENNVGCTNAAKKKRCVCDKHYFKLHKAGKLKELTDQFLQQTLVLERKPPEAVVEGFCLMKVNGVPCTNTPKRRGLCGSCIRLIEKTDQYSYEQFALTPVKSRKVNLERKQKIIKGICIIVEDGESCRKPSIARGLCDRHYRLVKKQKKMASIGLSQAEINTLPDIPHFYFDKNIVIRFAIYELFGTIPDSYSVALVDAVLKGKIRATVSLDCIRAVYSHLGHRFSRPSGEGGKELGEKEAEECAREYTGNLFFGRGGLWQFRSFDEHHFDLCAYKGRLPHFSLEDALELHLYALAKQENRTLMFITADNHILEYGEAVHPEKAVKAYSNLISVKHFQLNREAKK